MASSHGALTILGDHVVEHLLVHLTLPEILDYHEKLARCLIELTLGNERKFQPDVSIVNRPEGQRILFRPFTSSTSMGAKIIATPRPVATADGLRSPPLCGMVALCDDSGRPRGILNGKQITGYRTSMSAMIPFMWRHDVSKIVVFGAGLQALWHVRLALSLRASDIKSITILNRSKERAQALVSTVQNENSTLWKSAATFDCLNQSSQDANDDNLGRTIQEASVIFCTTASTTPLFPATLLTEYLGMTKDSSGPLITGVGSWQATMSEIHPDLIRHAIDRSKNIDFSSTDPRGSQNKGIGAIVSDDRHASMEHAGEIVQSRLEADEILEVADLLDRQKKNLLSAEVKEWMASGFLAYKSIGVSMTDLVTSEFILDLGRAKGLGTSVSDF